MDRSVITEGLYKTVSFLNLWKVLILLFTFNTTRFSLVAAYKESITGVAIFLLMLSTM
jgi:hypothetical protein